MRRLLFPLAGLMTAVFWLLAGVATGGAADLLRPLPGDIVLDFNSAYSIAGQATRYHTGVDIAGGAGAHVSAAAAGRVTFAGRIPRPAGDGPPILAVTVALDDGRLATYLPLEKACVAKGDAVAQGAMLGELADDGDASAQPTHLHFSLREHGNYVDPKPLPVPASLARQRPSPGSDRVPLRSPLQAAAPAQPVRPAPATTAPRSLRAGSPTLARPATAPRAVRPVASPAGAPAVRPTADQQWLHARLLRSNRTRPWIDPRLIEAASRPQEPQPAPRTALRSLLERIPRPRANPLALLFGSGALLAAASAPGRLGRFRRARVAPEPCLARGRSHG